MFMSLCVVVFYLLEKKKCEAVFFFFFPPRADLCSALGCHRLAE